MAENQVNSLTNRYLSGDCVVVWDEIYDLDYRTHQSDIDSVALLTMQRVRRNMEKIVERLREESFAFYSGDTALLDPPRDLDARLARIDERTQRLEVKGRRGQPLAPSVRAFYRTVGSVNLTGNSPGWPKRPIAKAAPHGTPGFLSDGLYVATTEWLEEAIDEIPDGSAALAFSPDIFHKEDYSGGPPYSWWMTSPSPDAFCTEVETAFVPYLRFSLSWGGFPGLRLYENAPLDWVRKLTEKLEPF